MTPPGTVCRCGGSCGTQKNRPPASRRSTAMSVLGLIWPRMSLAEESLHAAEIAPGDDLLASLAGLPGAFVLRSSLPDKDNAGPRRQARWTFFGAEPFASFRGGDPQVPRTLFRWAAHAAAGSEPARELGV